MFDETARQVTWRQTHRFKTDESGCRAVWLAAPPQKKNDHCTFIDKLCYGKLFDKLVISMDF